MASSSYSVIDAFDQAQLGYTLQRETVDALYAAWAANNFKPLSVPQIAAACLAAGQTVEGEAFNPPIPPSATPYPDTLPPVFPVSMPRFPDSNEEPFDGWVRYGPWLQGPQEWN